MKEKDVLRAKLEAYNLSYRAGRPQITDAEYDALLERFRGLDPDNDWFKHPEPAPVADRRKKKLPLPMKSLNKVKNLRDITAWINSLRNLAGVGDDPEITVMPKFDGISLLVDRIKEEAYSRGGADNEGQICSDHYKATGHKSNMPPQKDPFVFGELVFSRKNWEEYFAGRKQENGDPYKSPRNTVAGLINRDIPSPELARTTFYIYGASDPTYARFATFSRFIHYICCCYGQPFLYRTIPASELTEDFLAELFDKWARDFYIDGLVLYIDDFSLWSAIGRHAGTGNPLYAIAYKHPDFTQSFETTVTGITWNITKSGALKPVVNIEKVNTGDCDMENPTGYNYRWIKSNRIAKGAKLLVTRSGGVIPKILSILSPASDQAITEREGALIHCPHCGRPLRKSPTTPDILCVNPHCPGTRLAKIVHFYRILEAKDIGENFIQKLFYAGFDTLGKILHMTMASLVKIDGIGEVKAGTFVRINQAILAGADLPRLIHASDCFDGIGMSKASRYLEALPPDVFELYGEYMFHPSQLTPAQPIGEVTLQAMLDGYPSFLDFIRDTGIRIRREKKEANPDGACSKIKACFTGFRDKKLESFIERQGGIVMSTVNKNTTHVVAADPSGTSSKLEKAARLNIPVLTPDAFKALLQYQDPKEIV